MALATSTCATIGTLRPAHTSALPARTSATAAYGSSAALLLNMKVKSASTVFASAGTFGTASGISALRSFASTVASDSPSTLPLFQSTSSARTASMHWPKVRAPTATPVGSIATWLTPGIARTAALFRIAWGEPFSVGARQSIVGTAPGATSRSIANFFAPVTMSWASTRLCGLPMTAKLVRGLRSTRTGLSVVLAALAASSP